MEWVRIVIEIIALLVGGVGLYIGIRVAIARLTVETRMMKHEINGIKLRQDALASMMDVVRTTMDKDIEETRKGVGEVGLALRQKITEVELHIRDNFLRKESFREVIADIKGSVSDLGNKFDQGIRRIEDRMKGTSHGR